MAAVKGVTARKPFHELRKELGAIIASEQGIYAAQRMLRHRHIGTTAAYYADRKLPITSGLGAFLNQTPENVVDFAADGGGTAQGSGAGSAQGE
ncbi:MAG: hypothetical protein R3F11_08995 [Verrucomicrobiales bacterium]